jgi:hypothetical protein
MSTEQLKRLAISLGILLLLWASLSFLRRSGGDRVDGFRPTRFDRTAVTAIVIAKPPASVTLARNGTEWTVNGMPAAPEQVDQLLADLVDSTATGEVVAENRSSHARLGIDSASAKRVTVRAGDAVLLTYLVGNRGSSYESVYLRREHEDRVYQVKSRLAEAAERPVDDWRDKRILTLASDRISGVDVTRGRSSYSVDRAASGWTLGTVAADSGAVSRWITQLASLSASGFPTPAQADSADFSKPDRSLRIRGRTGQVLGSLAFDSISGGFLVRRDGQATIFRIETYTADQIFPVDSTLRSKTK